MNSPEEITIVYGAADSGHLENQEALKELLGCNSIFVGDFDPEYAEPGQYPVLVLMTVNDASEGLKFSRVISRRSVIHADLVMRLLKARSKP